MFGGERGREVSMGPTKGMSSTKGMGWDPTISLTVFIQNIVMALFTGISLTNNLTDCNLTE